MLNNIIYLTMNLESIGEKLFGFDSCASELTNVSSSSRKDRDTIEFLHCGLILRFVVKLEREKMLSGFFKIYNTVVER